MVYNKYNIALYQQSLSTKSRRKYLKRCGYIICWLSQATSILILVLVYNKITRSIKSSIVLGYSIFTAELLCLPMWQQCTVGPNYDISCFPLIQ